MYYCFSIIIIIIIINAVVIIYIIKELKIKTIIMLY